MSESNPFPSDLDMPQIIQQAYNSDLQRLRVDAEVTATIADVIIHSDESSITIGNPNNSNTLNVQSDGSIDVNTVIQSTSDNIAIGNQAGTHFVAVNSDGSINTDVTGTVTANIGTTNGLALDATLTNNTQTTQIVNSSGDAVVVKTVDSGVVSTDNGLVTNSVIYGHTTGGGGGYIEVKVNPSGSLVADVSGSSVNQGTSPWIIAGTVTTTPTGTQDVNIVSTVTLPVSGPLTDAELRATPVPISGTVTANAGTGNFTVVQSSGTSLHVNVDNFSATQAVTQSTSPWVTTNTNAGGASAVNIQDGGNSITVDGSVIATQGTSPWVISGTVTATPTGTQDVNIVSTISLPVTGPLTDTQLRATPVPISGTITSNQGTSPWVTTNINGTGASAVNIQDGGNSITVDGTITANAGTGNFTVVQATGTNLHAVLDSGSTTAVTQVTAANLNATVVQSSGANLHVNVDSMPTTTVTGTVAVTQSTSPWVTTNTNAAGASAVNIQDGGNSITVDGSITANAGTNLNTSLLQLDTTGAKLNLGQASTTSGQTGPLIQGAVTTSSPTYTTGQTDPLSLTTSGALRTDSSATTQPISGSVSVSNFPATQAVTQSTSPWIISGTVTANAGTNLNTSALALDASITTLNTSVNTLLKPANTLTAVTTVGTITNVVHVDDNAGSLTVDNNGTFLTQPDDGILKTYCATGTFVAAATPTDVFTITGSGTKTIRILRIGITGTQTTSSEVNMTLLKRSSANSAGTSTSLTNVPFDSGDAAATATVRTYTANPTLGSLVGNLRNVKLVIPVVAIGGNASAQSELVMDFSHRSSKPIFLRGTGEVLSINFNATTITGNSLSAWVEWAEI